jgi:hypothetical protein
MEDACNCVTCYSRLEDLPVILFMEWSKSSRPISTNESGGTETAQPPDDQAESLRDQVETLKIKLEACLEKRRELTDNLNEISEKVTAAKSLCESLEKISDMLCERVSLSEDSERKVKRICQDLESRIRRDSNRAVIGDLTELLLSHQSESRLSDFFSSQLAISENPDELLSFLGSLYDHYHKKVKETTSTFSQLKTAVHSLRRDVDDAGRKLGAAQRARLARTVESSSAQGRNSTGVSCQLETTLKRTRLHNITSASGADRDDFGIGKRSKYKFINS